MRFLFVYLLALLFVVGCSVETQKGRESFDTHNLPPQLAKLANQTIELRPLKNEIIARVQQDQNLFTLPVAVIDNGVDLAHPDLISKYTFKVQNNEIVGAGHDFMGDDEFSSSALINPEVFAFTASTIKNGLIVVGDRNPFEKMMELDAAVVTAMLKKIKADPVLSKSLFARLDKGSFNSFGLFRLVNDETAKNIFNPQTYIDTKAEGKLFGVDFRAQAASNEVLAKAWTLPQVYLFLDHPIQQLSPGSGYSNIFSYLNGIEHADVFVQKVKEVFNESAEAQELKTGIERLVEFRAQREHGPTVDRPAIADSASTFLSKAVEYHKQGITAKDPILGLQWSTLQSHLYKADLFRKPTDFPQIVVNPDTVNDAVKNNLRTFEEYREVLIQVPMSAQEKFALRAFNKTANDNYRVVSSYLTLRGEELKKLYDPNFHSSYTSLLRKYFFRNQHPYLSGMSEDESHGTHVSGIIVKQNEALRIYPVRVTTRSALVTKTEHVRMIAQYKAEFHKWLQTPVVAKAIFHKLGKMLPAGYTEPTTADERAKFSAVLMESMNEAIDMGFEAGSLDFIFFDELKQALRHVGQQKLKIANISLGAENNNEIPRLADIDPEKDLPKVFNFLNFEFVKFQFGEILSTEAKGTLFVVAAGNSSTWVDGKSHSALPVDVTSRFLAPFENGKDLVVPNNHLTNVLGVGSLNPDEDLSNFTNVILGMKTPMIFAVGEKILSPIKMTDLSPALSFIKSRITPITGKIPVMPNDSRFTDKVKERAEYAALKDDSEAASKISNNFIAAMSQLDSILSVYSTQLAMQYSDHREYYNGTSMATPAVVGTIGDKVIQKALALGLKPDQVYDHPEMTPAHLIQMIRDSGTPVFPESPEYPFKKIDVRGKYERGTKIQQLELKLKEILGN